MITGVHHAQITIPKGREEQARRFYCGVLGLREVPKPNELIGRGGFWLQLGQFQVHVGTEDGFDRTKTKAHLAYEATDLEEIKKTLVEQGIELLEQVQIPGLKRVEIRDPFGNRVEFIERLKE